MSFQFQPLLDIPLALLTLAGTWVYFNRWAKSKQREFTLDLVAQLPKARIRVALLVILTLLLCWYFNFGFWIVLGAIPSSMLLSIIANLGTPTAAVPWAIREVAFGYPHLVLHGKSIESDTDRSMQLALGTTVKTYSPLRPSGQIIVDDQLLAACSYDGTYIDGQVLVQVVDFRNGTYQVRVQA